MTSISSALRLVSLNMAWRPAAWADVLAAWQRPNAATDSSWIYADAIAHRLISDLSAFIGSVKGHRIIGPQQPRGRPAAD